MEVGIVLADDPAVDNKVLVAFAGEVEGVLVVIGVEEIGPDSAFDHGHGEFHL